MAREERFKVPSATEATGGKRQADESLDGAEPVRLLARRTYSQSHVHPYQAEKKTKA